MLENNSCARDFVFDILCQCWAVFFFSHLYKHYIHRTARPTFFIITYIASNNIHRWGRSANFYHTTNTVAQSFYRTCAMCVFSYTAVVKMWINNVVKVKLILSGLQIWNEMKVLCVAADLTQPLVYGHIWSRTNERGVRFLAIAIETGNLDGVHYKRRGNDCYLFSARSVFER